jgi:hypothetical protein
LDEDGTDGEHATWDELDSEGDDPLFVGLGDVEVDTVVDEETDDGSDLPPEFVETNETTADSSGCDLGDVDGSQVGGDTDTDTDDDTTGVHDAQTGLGAGSALNGGTGAEEDGGEAETPFATEEVTDRVTEKSTEEASCLVQGDDIGGKESLFSCSCLVGESEFFLEGLQGDRGSNECGLRASEVWKRKTFGSHGKPCSHRALTS